MKMCTAPNRVIKSCYFLLVMDVLKTPLQDLEDKYILMASISDDERLHEFLRSLCSNLKIHIANYTQESAERTWLNALMGWLASNAKHGCLLDIIKAVLLLKNEGIRKETVDRILDSLSSKIENQIDIKY